MAKNIHPELKDTKFLCSSGINFTTKSTMGGEVKIEVCSKCHPAYTGKQSKVVDTEGRIAKFQQKYGDYKK